MMMNVQAVKLELIKRIADLQNEQLLTQLRDLLTNEVKGKNAPALSPQESALLLKINEGLPLPVQEKYAALLAKSANGQMNEVEREELLTLIPLVEAKSAERLSHLVELAVLWNTTVDDVMAKLGISAPAVIHG